MRLPSASALSRAIACPASNVLPKVYQPASKYAQRGTIIHQFIEDARVDRSAALLAIEDDEVRKQAEAIDLSVIPAGSESEVAFGFNPWTRKAIRYELGEKRGYPDDSAFHGTADVCGREGRRVIIFDWKTGTSHSSAAESLQMRFLGLAAARLAGLDEALVAHLTLQHDGTWALDECSLDGWDLDTFEDVLVDLARRIKDEPEKMRAEQRPGDSCKWCSSATMCPAQQALVRATLPTLDITEPRITALTSSEWGAVWEWIKEAKDRIEIIENAAKEHARIEPLQLADGRVVKEVSRSVTKLDEVTAAAVLRDLGLVEKCAEFSLTHIKEVAPEAVAALERAGAVQVIQTSQVRAVGSARKRKAA